MNERQVPRLHAACLVLLLAFSLTGFAVAEDEEPAEPAEVAEAAEEGDPADEISDEDRETMALDSTATQWSFQFAYQTMPDYYDDVLDNGETRPEGATDYIQLRIVAPIPLKGFTILPRLTLRHYENAKGELYVNGAKVDEVMMPEMHISTFSLSETFDVGIDAGTPVSNQYRVTNHYPFTGELDKVVVKLTD